MNVAILSDIHGNDVAFEAVVNDMAAANVNVVVFLGDLVAKGPEPMACYNRMKSLHPMIWLKGNTEYWLDDAMVDIMPTNEHNRQLLAYYDYIVKHMTSDAMDQLIGLNHYDIKQFGHFEGLFCHGSARNPDEIIDPFNHPEELPEQLRDFTGTFVISGHSHQQYDTMWRGIRLINPGAVGVPPENGVGIARYAIVEAGASFKVILREVSYDIAKLQMMSTAKGFPTSRIAHF